jgi:hypothetical protein
VNVQHADNQLRLAAAHGGLVRVLGAGSGISKREVSRICADLDPEVGPFRDPQRY